MNTVLIVGSDFVPSSLPPATRIRFFARHLPEFGWNPIILTTRPEFYEWLIDPENEHLLPPTTEVIRTSAFSSRWTRKMGVGDIGMRSMWHHWKAIKRICRQRKVDLIFIPVPPSAPMVLGRLAHRKFSIPYVIDYIDPWVTDSYKGIPRHQRPPKWFFADVLSRTLEPIALKRVAHITGVSKGTTDSVVQRYDWLTEKHATEIPYGAEAEDFEYLRQRPRENPIFDPHDGLVHISYVGACIPAMHSTVRAVLAAVKCGLEREPLAFSRLRLHFVGTSYASNGNAPNDVLRLAREAGVESHVDERASRVTYLESLQIMLDSDGLILLGSSEAHYTASKLFPYILSQRPLLAIFHVESSVVSIIRTAQAGEVITFDGEQGPTQKIIEISKQLERIVSQTEPFNPDTRSRLLEQFSTSAMTARLAGCFMKAVTDSTA